MAVDKTYKEGGTGKGVAVRQGLDLSRFGENLTKTRGTRKLKCLDCSHFKGINPIDVVTCEPEANKHKTLTICETNFKDEYE